MSGAGISRTFVDWLLCPLLYGLRAVLSTTDRKNKRHFGAPTRQPATSAPRQPRRSGSQQGVARPRETWTGRSGWGRVAPQGFLGAKVSGRAVLQGWEARL